MREIIGPSGTFVCNIDNIGFCTLFGMLTLSIDVLISFCFFFIARLSIDVSR